MTPKKTRGYFPAKPESEERSVIFGAFDVETNGLGGELLLATWYIEGMLEAQIIKGTPSKIVDELLDVFCTYPKQVRWYAHNAQYDWRYIIDALIERFSDTLDFFMRTDNDIFMITTDAFELVDSFAIWPHSLKSLGEQFAPYLPKMQIDIEHFDVTNPTHLAYAKRDSELLVKALIGYDDEIYRIFGIHLSFTVASTAQKAWKQTIDEPYFQPKQIDDFVRSAYFGGLVAFSTIGKQYNVMTYDRNSSYAATMRDCLVPYGSHCRTKTYVPGELGIYRVVIETPPNLIFPIIPKRMTKGKASWIVWPQGKFETTCTNIELDFALHHGYKLCEVIDGLLWEDAINPFVSFINLCQKTRAAYKGTPTEQVAKLIQNSLYGKFGAKKERAKLFISKSDDDKIGAYPWGDSDKLYIRTESSDIMALPQWAVFITANARIELLRIIYQIGPSKVIYCDTDSITTSEPFPLEYIGDDYGLWKLEKIWKEFRVVAPKVYAGKLANGALMGACKGIPKRNVIEDHYRALLENGSISANISILPSLKSYMKGNRETLSQTRRSTNLANSKSWKHNNNHVQPVIIET